MNTQAIGITFAPLLLLLIPLLGSWPWDETDFIVMGALLLILGGGLAFITTKIQRQYRVIAALVLVGVFLLTWAELAVGIFGTPFAGS